VRWWDVIRGVVREFGVDAGGPAADTADVGAEFGEFAGIGVDDPAVRVLGFLPSGVRPWCSHLRMVPVVTLSSAASSVAHARRKSQRHLAGPTAECRGMPSHRAPSGITCRSAACFEFGVRRHTPPEGYDLAR
jgi:hypothetical protein